MIKEEKNTSGHSISDFLDDESKKEVEKWIDTPNHGFKVAFLKHIREKYITPNLKRLNRSVLMVNEGSSSPKKIIFAKCGIADAKFNMPELRDIVKNNVITFTTKDSKKLLQYILRIGYFTQNNAWNINFRHLRINNSFYRGYAYCNHIHCNTYLSIGDFDGNVKFYCSKENKKTYQHRDPLRIVEGSDVVNTTVLTHQQCKVNEQ